MHATLVLGPLSLPTGPILALIAAVLALEVAGRAGRRLGLRADDVWNTGLWALLAGLIVARLWTLIQFWPAYRAEPLLLLSLRPSGFALGPGIIAAALAAFGWMLWRALDPARVAAALALGLVAGGVVINCAQYLTGAVVGLPSSAPWAVRYFLQIVHPVALYRALGLLILLALLWLTMRRARPARTLWLAALGYALVYLAADAFVADPALLGAFRRSQVIALLAGVAAALLLAREAARAPQPAPDAPPAPTPPPTRPADAPHA